MKAKTTQAGKKPKVTVPCHHTQEPETLPEDIPQSETFICQSCDQSELFSQAEILQKKQSDPMLIIQGFDYYIPCPFCHVGMMLSQLDLVFEQFATDLFGF